ncbi:hypothetical protein LWI29_018273 [Acer saccharum]|uniref:Uncharacterized protein n=1 Tax=Acer saccharum TaxID=4024 RepID=A0AA39SNS8_ACESA|nr:hypothetical protein LWI29_018273 [Acer saccharum]
MEIMYLVVREKVQQLQTAIVHIVIEEMITDPLTKRLSPKVFQGHVTRMGLVDSHDMQEQFVKTDSEIVTNIPSLPCHFFVFTNDFKFVGGGGFSDSSSSSLSSPSSSSLSLLRFVAVNDNGGSGGSLFRQ